MSDHFLEDSGQLRRQIVLTFLPDIILTVVAPIFIYRLATPHMSSLAALLLASAAPLLNIGFGLLHRRLKPLGALSALTIALKITVALITKDARWVLLSTSLITGVHGLLMLGSLLVRKPLLLWIIEGTLTNASEHHPLRGWLKVAPRSSWFVITAILGSALLLECGINILLALTQPVEYFLVISPIVRYSMFGGAFIVILLVAWIRRISKRKHLVESSNSTSSLPEASPTTPSR